MHGWCVHIAALEGDIRRAEALAVRLRQAWPEVGPPRFHVVSDADLAQMSLTDIQALVMIAPAMTRSNSAFTLLSALEEAAVPVMAIVDDILPPGNPFEFTGALIADPQDTAEMLNERLRGILHRQKIVRQLMSEVSLARRCHGGLEGQIVKMHEELQLAAMVQREFLPRDIPSLHGVTSAALWRPTNYVSGDIYDVIRLDEDHIGLFIADAVGHGVPAALMTMVIARSLVTKEIIDRDYRLLEPAEVLFRLNSEMIRRQGESTRFATACYGVLNCRSRLLKLAGAGHPPPLLLAADGSSRLLETEGGLLGVFADETYSQIEVELCLDDTVLIYSDGFEQAFPAELSTTIHERKTPTLRYRDEFQQLAAFRTPVAMIQHISQRLDDQCGSLHQLDDLTLICTHAGQMLQQPKSENAGAMSSRATVTTAA